MKEPKAVAIYRYTKDALAFVATGVGKAAVLVAALTLSAAAGYRMYWKPAVRERLDTDIFGEGECRPRREERQGDNKLRYRAGKYLAYDGDGDKYVGLSILEDAFKANGLTPKLEIVRVGRDNMFFTAAYADEAERNKIDLLISARFHDEFEVERVNFGFRSSAEAKAECWKSAYEAAVNEAHAKASALRVGLGSLVEISEESSEHGAMSVSLRYNIAD